jgi:hypothetical protein
MRVVFLTSRMPFPPEGGDRFRVFHLLRTAVEAGHEVHLVTFDRSVPARVAIAPLERLLASIRVVHLPKLVSTLRAAQALSGRIPLQAAYYHSRRMSAVIGHALDRVRPDVVYTHLFRMAPYAIERMERHRARWILDLTDVISAGIVRSSRTAAVPTSGSPGGDRDRRARRPSRRVSTNAGDQRGGARPPLWRMTPDSRRAERPRS